MSSHGDVCNQEHRLIGALWVLTAFVAILALASWLQITRYSLDLFEKVHVDVQPGMAQEEVIALLGEPQARLPGLASLREFLREGGFEEMANVPGQGEALVYIRLWFAHVVFIGSHGLVQQVRSTKT